MPLAVHLDARKRANFYGSYLGASLARDVLDLSRVRQVNLLPRLMERLAAQTGHVLNIVKAPNGARIEPRSGDNYVRLLEAPFLIRRLPAWAAHSGHAPHTRQNCTSSTPGSPPICLASHRRSSRAATRPR